ncbi:MAG: Uma2 family endonuclease [Cytophagales bacterium]|nr:MAG: Uma2 family endonuclease [Cytophagales bacterium]
MIEKIRSRNKFLVTVKNRFEIPKKLPKKVSLEEFEAMDDSDLPYKLEWKDNYIIKEASMKFNERIIIQNIIDSFNSTNQYKNNNRIMAEADVFMGTTNSVRKPDACYLTRDEIVNHNDHKTVPQLVIEVASKSNSALDIQLKVSEYFANGNCTIWYIYPEVRLVQVYTTLKTVKICTESDLCEAILDGQKFQISVDDIFKDFKLK